MLACISQGIGIPTNLARARELYEEACEAGSSTAAFFLGHRYHVGDEDLGIVRDGQRALQLLTKASEQVRRVRMLSFSSLIGTATFLLPRLCAQMRVCTRLCTYHSQD